MPVTGLPNTKFTVNNGIYVSEFYAKHIIISSSYFVLPTDYIILFNSSAAGSSIDFYLNDNGPFVNGKILYIKDIGGNASTNAIHFTNGKIDGNDAYNINTNYGGIQIIYNDDNWHLLSNC